MPRLLPSSAPLSCRNLWLVVSFVCLVAAPGWTQSRDRRLSQYAHSVWRLQDGAFSGTPNAIAQTADGYLWIGTSTGLARFDGIRIAPWASNDASQAPLASVFSLRGSTDGSLWIGTGSTVSRLKDGRLTTLPTPLGRIGAIVEHRGSVWITRTRPVDDKGALCQVSETQARCYGKSDGFPIRAASALAADGAGNLWVGGNASVARWSQGSSSTYAPSQLKPAGLNAVPALAADADGSIWVGISRSGPGLGLQQIQNGVWKPLSLPGIDASSLVVNALFLDRDNAMWIGTENQGLYRFAGGDLDRFTRADGLSADSVNGFYQDREGNVWVLTPDGIDCFRKTPMVSFSTREGLTANQAASVLAARDGTIWIGNQGALDAIRDGRVSSLTPKNGLPGASVTSLLEDHAGRLWFGIDNGLSVLEGGKLRSITRPDGKPIGFVLALAEDRAQNIWAILIGTPRRLIRIESFSVREDIPSPQVPAAASLAADPVNGIWLGLDSGDLARYRGGQLETFRFNTNVPGAVRQVTATADGAMLGTMRDGLLGWRDGTLRTLTVQNGLPCRGVHAFVFDAQNALWLYTPCGLVRISPADLQKWWRQGDAIVDVRVFDALDGVRSAAASFVPRASRGPDGRLWFANETVVQTIDPAHLTEKVIPTTVHIEQLIADRQRYPATSEVRLPPLTRDLEIDYVGLSFLAPLKLRFRYRLEGRDTEWQESQGRRQAFYSDLRPGPYRFQVIATNSDGLWNDQAAAIDIVVAPAWYQTIWFLILSVGTAILVVWVMYQRRVQQLAQSFNARFDERLAERTRVARDLHDTLLQTVQGSKMVADNALTHANDPDGLRRAMEQVSTWLGQASTEGRAAVNALRASTIETNDLAAAFRRAIEDCRRNGSLETSLTVIGDPREMHPVVRDEVYRIGYEAIRNACTHSRGNRLEIELTYARHLVLRIADDGVGVDPVVATEGRDGHFGLQGMRERAKRIGAQFSIVSSAETGTTITLSIPGRAIFREGASHLFDRLRRQFLPKW